jgi:putative flippase GtrA
MFLVDFFGYILLCNLLLPHIASAVSQGTAALGNFVLQRYVVFPESRRSVMVSFALTILISCISIFIGSLTVYLVRIAQPEWIVLPKVVAIGIVFIWNYFTRKHIVFPPKQAQSVSISS